jgi:hypothetical protein
MVPSIRVLSNYSYQSRKLIKPRLDSSAAGAFSVYLDGKLVGMLPSLASCDYDLAPGNHTIQVRCRIYRSKKVAIEVERDQDLVFTTTIPKTFSSALRLLFRPLSSISLERLLV